jgi:hypothetical protein
MKQKKYLFIAAAAALFTACSSDDSSITEKQQAPEQQQAVEFGAYVNRGTTRAGTPGILTTDGTSGTTTSLETVGFGVFGYYTDNQPYNETSTPNFMYNQQVSTDAWTYSPIKYWPNEFGTGAISDGEDRLTFFAYAPWVPVTPETGLATGSGTTGIVALTRNTASGDPYVKYYADFDPDQSVDLCWGVAKWNFASTVTGPTANDIDAGKTYVDVIKPKTQRKIDFDFKHALAALNVQIDADVNTESHQDGDLDEQTKIWVRSVSFTGFSDKGMLNLNGDATTANYTPNWFDLSGNTKIGTGTVTIHDGRRDGKEGQTGAEVSNEKPLGLNTVLIQNEPYATTSPLALATGTTVGVQHEPVNLFNSATLDKPIFVIPTEENLEVTIVYDVETYDPSLASYLSDGKTKGSTIENKITKTIQISGSDFKLQAGKKYTIGLHLGMTSVKFNASVTEWVDATADNTDLPHNTD